MSKDLYYKKAYSRQGKLYFLLGDGIVVIKAWPPSAWYTNTTTASWTHCRPDLYDLQMRKPLHRLHRAEANCQDIRFMPWQNNNAGASLDRKVEIPPERDSMPEHIGAILMEMAKNNLVPPEEIPCPERYPNPERKNIQRLLAIRDEVIVIKRFFEKVPPEVRSAISPFPERHFSLASFSARCPGGLDLIHSTPALAMILANSWCFGRKVQRPLRSARTLLKKTQRQQLAWLGYGEASKSTIRILRKIPPECCSIELLLYLRNALQDDAARKHLEHLPRINRGAVFLLSDPVLLQRIGYHFLLETALHKREDCRARIGRNMRQWLEMAAGDADAMAQRFNSVHEFQQHYADTLELQRLGAFSELSFPAPPLAGTPEIVPIKTPLELLQEGKQQRHCILSYAETIARLEGYAYRVKALNERATLFIEPETPDRSLWKIAECRGFANKPISTLLLGKLLDWLDQATEQGGIPMMNPNQLDLF